MEEGKGPVDTSHLYEGKVVRSSAPSRKGPLEPEGRQRYTR